MTSIEFHAWADPLQSRLPELVWMLEEDQGVTEVQAEVRERPPALQIVCRMETGAPIGDLVIPLFVAPLWPGPLVEAQVALELEINGVMHIFDYERMIAFA